MNCLFLNGLKIATNEKFITSGIAGNAITALKPSRTSIPLKTSRYGTAFSPHCWSHSSKGSSVKAAHRNIDSRNGGSDAKLHGNNLEPRMSNRSLQQAVGGRFKQFDIHILRVGLHYQFH
jgi:hypothetical protein